MKFSLGFDALDDSPDDSPDFAKIEYCSRRDWFRCMDATLVGLVGPKKRG